MDVATIKDETGCSAVLCLQSHACFEALGIDHPKIFGISNAPLTPPYSKSGEQPKANL